MIKDELFPMSEETEGESNINNLYTPTGGTFPKKTHYIPAELSFREDFVREYLTDRNAVSALMRLGHTQSVALSSAPRLMSEDYVKDLIAKREHRLTGMDNTKKDEVLRTEMELILRQIMNDSAAKGSERVAAARELASLRGFHAPVKGEDGEHLGGVMVVPHLPNSDEAIDDWEKLSIISQQQLKRDVIKDI